MPVELLKRKAHQQPTEAAPAAKKKSAASKVTDGLKKVVKGAKKDSSPKSEPKKAETKKAAEPKKAAAKTGSGKVAPGDVIDFEQFCDSTNLETNDGEKTSLKELVEESGAGVVLFTYPKASTPGCKSPLAPFSALTNNSSRHDPSLPLPRLLRAPHRRRPQDLRPQRRQPQGQHHLQDEAEAALPASLR